MIPVVVHSCFDGHASNALGIGVPRQAFGKGE
jgi:hypothetical protein